MPRRAGKERCRVAYRGAPRFAVVALALLSSWLGGCTFLNVTFEPYPPRPARSAQPLLGSVHVAATQTMYRQDFAGSWTATQRDASSDVALALDGSGLFRSATAKTGPADVEARGSIALYQEWSSNYFLSTFTAFLIPSETNYRITVGLTLSLPGSGSAHCSRVVQFRAWRQLLLMPLLLTHSAFAQVLWSPTPLLEDCAHEVVAQLDPASSAGAAAERDASRSP